MTVNVSSQECKLLARLFDDFTATCVDTNTMFLSSTFVVVAILSALQSSDAKVYTGESV
jgi:hypothetical protein